MGLFSKKKESHTIEEALKNHDKNFSYTTRTGYTYDDFPYMMQHTLWNNICATSFDDAFEMYAPNFLATIEETNKNIKILLEQNQMLQEKVRSLENKVSNLEQNHTPTIKR